MVKVADFSALNHSIISPLWVRASLGARVTCGTSQVLLAGVSGGFSPGTPVFAPPTDWFVSIWVKKLERDVKLNQKKKKKKKKKKLCFLLHLIFQTRPTAKPYSGTIFLCYMQPKSVDWSNITRLVEKRDCTDWRSDRLDNNVYSEALSNRQPWLWNKRVHCLDVHACCYQIEFASKQLNQVYIYISSSVLWCCISLRCNIFNITRYK